MFVPNLHAQEKPADAVARIDHDRILWLANRALHLKPPAITDHVATNSTGGLHDFYSQADYAWPNKTNATGRPYITRDGESNPDTFSYHRMAMRDMKDAVAALASAYVLTGDDKYVLKAAEFIKVFFLDEKTRMNPNLQYAQAVLGATSGNAYGVIDTLHLAELPVAVRFLEKSSAFDPAVDEGLKKWFADYSEWIITSTNGVKEMNNPNNHSIACFVQLASFAKFTRDEKLLELCRTRFKEVLLPGQMTNNGSFPRELARTKPYGYSIFQADNLAALCVLLSTTNEDFWKFQLPDGRTPRNSVDFIYPYLADKNKWLADGHKKDVMHWDNWPMRQPCLIFAYAEFGDEKYFNLWKKQEADPTDLEIRRNVAITQPLLWLANPGDKK
jgi:Alginate lyase